jgi:hypothetical protein
LATGYWLLAAPVHECPPERNDEPAMRTCLKVLAEPIANSQ